MQRHRGGGHVGGSKEVQLGLIITPMLDMAFQLLAFFVMTYHPSALEGHINGKLLPPEKIAVKGTAPPSPDKKEEPMPADVDPSVQDAVMVIVTAVPEGEVKIFEKDDKEIKKTGGTPSKIMVKTPESPEPETIAFSNSTIDESMQKLLDYLRIYRKAQGEVDSTVKMMFDANLRYKYATQVWDICKGAGFKTIGFVAPPQ